MPAGAEEQNRGLVVPMPILLRRTLCSHLGACQYGDLLPAPLARTRGDPSLPCYPYCGQMLSTATGIASGQAIRTHIVPRLGTGKEQGA